MHGTIRATILPTIIRLLCQRYHWEEMEALDRFYTSVVGEFFSDDDSGFYGQSPYYIAGEFFQEQEEAWPQQPEQPLG